MNDAGRGKKRGRPPRENETRGGSNKKATLAPPPLSLPPPSNVLTSNPQSMPRHPFFPLAGVPRPFPPSNDSSFDEDDAPLSSLRRPATTTASEKKGVLKIGPSLPAFGKSPLCLQNGGGGGGGGGGGAHNAAHITVVDDADKNADGDGDDEDDMPIFNAAKRFRNDPQSMPLHPPTSLTISRPPPPPTTSHATRTMSPCLY